MDVLPGKVSQSLCRTRQAYDILEIKPTPCLISVGGRASAYLQFRTVCHAMLAALGAQEKRASA